MSLWAGLTRPGRKYKQQAIQKKKISHKYWKVKSWSEEMVKAEQIKLNI